MKRISAVQVQTSERFFRVPKVFVESPYYKKMSTEAKFTYAILKDRFELSLRNNWVDKNGDVYLIYTVDELQDILGYGKNKVIRLKKELVEHGLLEEVRQGLNKPNLLYLGNVDFHFEPLIETKNSSKPLVQAEVSKSNFRKNQGSFKNKLQEVSKSNSNDTENNEFYIKNSSRRSGTDTVTQNQSENYIPTEYYSLLQVIADKYNNRYMYPEGYTLTHHQKMQIGQYLSSGYANSNEVLDMIDRIPSDCERPLAYLLKMLDNLREERRLEEKIVAHKNAQRYYQGQK